MSKRSQNVRSSLTLTVIEKIPLFLIISILGLATGCQSPMSRKRSDSSLKQSLAQYESTELAGVSGNAVTLTPPENSLKDDFTPERLRELEQKAGPQSYPDTPISVGDDLLGDQVKVVRIGLREAVQATVKNNLDVQVASMNPAISEAGITAAEARFDGSVLTNIGFDKTDEPSPTPIIQGIPVGTGFNASQSWRFRTAIQKNLITGGQIEVATEVNRSKNQNPGLGLAPDPAYSTSVELAITQPLLRGFGSEVNLAQVNINRNAHRNRIEGYRSSLLTAVNQIELAYWQLWQNRQAVRIGERLLDRGRETADKLVKRQHFDAKPSEISDAKSRVQRREITLRRARESVLRASDNLKTIMNAPGYPVGNEIMVVPTDQPVKDPVTFNYRDAVLTALRNRPEIRQALLNIDDASIRQLLADNLRLPRLDVDARIRWNALDSTFGQAYGGITDDNFIDYIVNAVVEFPIGNREAQSNYRAARLQRMQSTVLYERTVQQVIQQVKDSLRAVQLNYELLSPTRYARLAAAEALRTIEVQEEHQAAMTPEFLNLKLQRQETLASAELDEISTIATYQVSLAQFYTAIGFNLQRNNIDFVVPEAKSYK